MSKKIIPDNDLTIGESMATTFGEVIDSECIACGRMFASSKILIADPVSTVRKHIGLCPHHQNAVDNGLVVMVALNPDTPKYDSGKVDPHKLMRTGRVAELTGPIYTYLFEQDPPPHGIVFTNDDVVDGLERIKDQVTHLDGSPVE